MPRGSSSFVFRCAVIAALILTVASASGCRWFRKDSAYQQPPESRPLEVPPDLDRPNTEGALGGTPQSVMRSEMSPARPAAGTATAAGNSFTTTQPRDAAYAKLGEVLAATSGLTVTSKAELLGVYDVNYEGGNFLVRVSPSGNGAVVSAVDARGVAATSPAAVKLIAALRAALGG